MIFLWTIKLLIFMGIQVFYNYLYFIYFILLHYDFTSLQIRIILL